MKNKKTIIHFSLAVALIIGICITAKSKPSQIKTSKHLSSINKKADTVDKLAVNKNESPIQEKKIEKVNVEKIKKDGPDNKNDYDYKQEIASIRFNFDVTDSEQVKNVQKILGLQQDGIFGPKTSEAWQAALQGQNKLKTEEESPEKNELYSENRPLVRAEASLSKTDTMLD